MMQIGSGCNQDKPSQPMTINLGAKLRPRTDWSLFYPLPPADMLNCLALLMSVWCKDYLFTLHQENKSMHNLCK